jgi:hypothetical protein
MASLRIKGRTGWMATTALFVLALQAEKKPAAAPSPDLKPAVSIEVDALGYKAPGTFYLTYQLSSAAMGFFDNDHLLFTFRVGGLLSRVPNDPAGDDDQQIRAVVLDLRTGKVEQQSEWRMHDRSQYLWPYKDGKFLVRERDTLFVTDQSLRLEPFMTFDAGIRAIQISADRKLMVVETNEPEKIEREPTEPRQLGTGEPVKVRIFTLGEKTPFVETEGQGVTLLPLMGDGLLDMLEGKGQGFWVLRDVRFHDGPKVVADVKSTCQPSARPVSASVALMVGCYADGDDREVIAVSTDGGECVGMVRFGGEREPVRVRVSGG